MTTHGHHQEHQHKHDHHGRKTGIHRDWRFWTAIVLMLVAMGAYILTFDESLEPGGQISPEVPAAAE